MDLKVHRYDDDDYDYYLPTVNGTLTQPPKLRRGSFEKKYNDRVPAWYEAKKEVLWA